MSVDETSKFTDLNARFRELCKEHDVVGITLFLSKDNRVMSQYLNASWGVMRESPGNKIRILSKPEEFPNPETQKEMLMATADALSTIIEWAKGTFVNTTHTLRQLQSKFAMIWKPASPALILPPNMKPLN